MYHDLSCHRDKVNRAAGWRAAVMVFASPLRQFYHDETKPARLSGLRHLDSYIWTRKRSSVYRDFAKTHANPDTDGNSPYHRAVMCKVLDPRQLASLDIHPTHNSKKNNICTYTRTPIPQARVWQPATATTRATAKHMLFLPIFV